MQGWKNFDHFFEDSVTYTEVTPEYAEWSEGVNEHNMDNDTYITFQDAIKALGSFIEEEEKQTTK